MSDLVPQRIAGRWVSAELTIDGAVARVRVGISVRDLGELRGGAVAVQVLAGGRELEQLTAPPPDVPLPCSAASGAYAWAEFAFANPDDLIPTAIRVTVEGETASFGLGDAIPAPPPPPAAPPVTMSLALLRPDDLLNLRVDAVNLKLGTSDREHPVLVHDDPESEALLIVRFAPQTLVEEAYFAGDGPTQKLGAGEVEHKDSSPVPSTPAEPGGVAARLGEETRLVFRVPHGMAIPYSIAGLLDWSKLTLVVSPVADVKVGEEPGAAALTIRPPGPAETTLQLPYRLHLSPAHDVAWDHARSPVIHRQRAELWHTRLALRAPDGHAVPTDPLNTVDLRAIWSPDYSAGPLPSPGDLGPFGHLAAMSGYDRHQIVALTSAFRGYAADEFTSYVPRPLSASLVMLSSLGGWLRSLGQWDPPYRIAERPWRGGVTSDRLLRTIGEEALLAREAERPAPPPHGPHARRQPGPLAGATAAAHTPAPEGFSRIEASLIDARQWLRIPLYDLGQQLDLSQWAHVASQGRDHYVRIVYDGHLKELGHRAALVKVTERRFEEASSSGVPVAYLRQFMYVVVREPEKNYELEGLADDCRGMPLTKIRLTTLVTPHIDYPYPDKTRNPTNDPKLPNYNPAAVTDRSFWVRVGGEDFRFHARGVDVGGNVIDFTKSLVFVPNSEENLAAVDAAFNDPANRKRRAASVPGQKVTFAHADPGNENTSFVTASLNFENEAADRARFFKPRLFCASVQIPAVEHLTGAATLSTIRLVQPYLATGFTDPANATGAFAEIVTEDAKGALQSAGLGVGFTASQAGGFAAPNLDIRTLTRAAGPLGSELNDARANHFEPSKVFKNGLATLFGVFDLADLLPAGDADKLAPTMQITRDATTVWTSLDWQSDVKEPVVASDVVRFVRNPDTRLDVKALIRKDLTGASADSSRLTGKLNHFSVAFFKVLQLNFGSFDFAAESGRKTDVNVALDPSTPVKFEGDLEFVEGLRELIPPGVFGDGVSIDLLESPLGVHAGVGIGLPPASVGVFALKNIAFSAGLTIPFLDGKPIVDFAFARRDNPFLLAVALLGGGGFFHIELDTDGMRILEASFEFGAVAALNIGVASGEVHIMAGIYFKMEKRAVAEKGGQEMMISSLTGYLRCGGRLSVLGLVTVSVEFYLAFTYYPELTKARGTATLTVAIHVACFSKSVNLTVERSFGAQGGDPTFGQMIDTPELWSEYTAAFA
jgi:hypothetical protein